MVIALLPALALAARLAPATPAVAAPYDTAQAWVDARRISAVVSNIGSVGLDLTRGLATWDRGFTYPRDPETHPFFALGLWVTGQVDGTERAAISEYSSEFRPGPILPSGDAARDDPAYRVYRVEHADTTGWAAWVAEAGPLGAPLAAGGTAPLVRGNISTWAVYNDADPARHLPPFGLAPLGLEVRHSAWAFDEDGARGATILLRWEILAHGAATLDSAYVGMWADPDVGWRVDDVSTDSARGLAYLYDPPQVDAVYGTAQPAFGVRLVRGARAAPGGSDLGATAMATYINGTDPASDVQCARLLRGLRADGSPFTDPETGGPTRFPFGGDPRAGTGWVDANPADRKFVIASGPFTFAPGDTQVIEALLVVGQGPDRLASIDSLYRAAFADYDAPVVDPPGPSPFVPPVGIEVAPNPAPGPVALRFQSLDGVDWRLDAYDARGRPVARVAEGRGTGRVVVVSWDRAGVSAAGLYWVVLSQGEERMTRKVVLVHP